MTINEYQKLDVYKRIAAIESDEEMEDMMEELIDRFGDIPKKVEKLLEVARLKALAHSVYLVSVEQKGDRYIFTMYEKAKVNPLKIPDVLQSFKGELQFNAAAENPYFVYQKKNVNKKAKAESSLEIVKNVLNRLKALLEE